MSNLMREIRRAPARILTTILALALAIGAIGVLAVPAVAASSLREAAKRDGLANIVLSTNDTGNVQAADVVGSLPNVDRAESQVEAAVAPPVGPTVTLVGNTFAGQQIEKVQLDQGRLPSSVDEVVVAPGTSPLGARLDVTTVDGRTLHLDVVGIGRTSSRIEANVMFADLATARSAAGVTGGNRLVIRADDMSAKALDSTVDAARAALAARHITFTTLPVTTPGGRHPVEADIQQISTLIGLLGLVAGLVALVLLASTTNTLITERSREVAVMRALGARRRPLRRRLRRLAISIAAAAALIGVPLGIVVANVIARLVLHKALGLTPAVAVSVPVMVGSALFALVGARLVSARAARRVTRVPLAEALRDRDGSPYGRRLSERLAARVRIGALLDRLALRTGLHHRARALATVAQITAAVAALMIIASIATTINDFNAAEYDTWNWTTATTVPTQGLNIDRSVVTGEPRAEVGILVPGKVDNWEVDVRGLAHDTAMFSTKVDSGQWFSGPSDAVVSAGFAKQTGIHVGDAIDVQLPTGPERYQVSGLYPDRGRTVIVGVDALATTLGRPDRGNVVYSFDERLSPTVTSALGPVTDVQHLAALRQDDSGRSLILTVFGAIGLVVVTVAGLAVASGLAVSVFERRHEFAALRAIGGRRRSVFHVIVAELLPLGVVGVGLGLVAGYFGGLAIAQSFERSDAVEIGFTYATGVVPIAVAVTLAGLALLGALAMRGATRQPLAVTLRGAA